MIWYLFRHGQTLFTKFSIPYGPFVKSASILPEGRIQARTIGEELKNKNISAFFASPYKRCRQTADIVSSITKSPFEFDDRLREQEILNGKESFSEFSGRINAFISDTKAKGHKSVAVCSHGWPLAILATLIKKGTASEADLHVYPKPGEWIKIIA